MHFIENKKFITNKFCRDSVLYLQKRFCVFFRNFGFIWSIYKISKMDWPGGKRGVYYGEYQALYRRQSDHLL